MQHDFYELVGGPVQHDFDEIVGQGSCATRLSRIDGQGPVQHDFYELVEAGVLCSMI